LRNPCPDLVFKSWTLVAVVGRIIEAVLIIIGVVSILSILTLRQGFAAEIDIDVSVVKIADKVFRSIHSWAFILGPNFMLGINTLLYSSLLYTSKLVPRPLSTLGLVGAVSVFAAALLELFGVINQVSTLGVVLAIPVALFEMILAIWLIVKGFNLLLTNPVKTDE
jgi:hypothetical protein